MQDSFLGSSNLDTRETFHRRDVLLICIACSGRHFAFLGFLHLALHSLISSLGICPFPGSILLLLAHLFGELSSGLVPLILLPFPVFPEMPEEFLGVFIFAEVDLL